MLFRFSRKCYRCGHIAKVNRQGNKFKCKKLGLEDHADVNVAKNIFPRYQRSNAIPLSASSENILKIEKIIRSKDDIKKYVKLRKNKDKF